MTPADRAKLHDLQTAMGSGDDRVALNAIRDYYRDADRSDRTSREWIYLHLGFAIGVADRLLDEKGKT